MEMANDYRTCVLCMSRWLNSREKYIYEIVDLRNTYSLRGNKFGNVEKKWMKVEGQCRNRSEL